MYYISLHSLLKEKETNRPLERFDSNKTSTTRTRKTETFVRSKKVLAFYLSRLHLNAKDNFSLELLHGYKLVERLKIRITKAPLCCFGGRVDLFYYHRRATAAFPNSARSSRAGNARARGKVPKSREGKVAFQFFPCTHFSLFLSIFSLG